VIHQFVLEFYQMFQTFVQVKVIVLQLIFVNAKMVIMDKFVNIKFVIKLILIIQLFVMEEVFVLHQILVFVIQLTQVIFVKILKD
jgi:hypothetical protein